MAYVRRVAGDGAAAFIVNRGDEDAGTIFIRINLLNGTSRLYGPAPAGMEEVSLDRRWCPLLDGRAVEDREVDMALAREREFDSDVWIIEVEDRDGRHFLDDWLN